VTLSPHNVYACLACGKYFQGRGPNTQAYTHALEAAHHVFMHLDTARVYCLPDAYEILDRSLDDIRRVLNPTFAKEEVANADRKKQWSRALDGSDYLTGAVGLNNLKATDYVNVVVQALNRVAPLRDFFLAGRECSPPTGGGVSEGATRAQPATTGSSSGSGASSSSLLTRRFGELTRKMWNPRNFKGQVSPHEFMQAAMRSSANRFAADAQSDPVEFLSWFLHAAHRELVKAGRVAKGGQSVVNRCFPGRAGGDDRGGGTDRGRGRFRRRRIRGRAGDDDSDAVSRVAAGPSPRASVPGRDGEERDPAGGDRADPA
jgi:U4/U6.U5 tri-snRNP-associated protein 2